MLSLYAANCYFALDTRDPLGTTLDQVNLSASYPMAVVKALNRADGRFIENEVPLELRTFEGIGVPRFSFGKHVGNSVKGVLRADPGYLRWIFNETSIETYRSGEIQFDSLSAV